jgi:hypothetical protein
MVPGPNQDELLLRGREGALNVGFGEVVAFEEERLPGVFGQGIGAAIADVESCRMMAFSKIPPRSSSECELLLSGRHDFDTGFVKE